MASLSPKSRQLRQWLRSQLDRLDDNTEGGAELFRELKARLELGALKWTGSLPFGYNPSKARAKA